MIDSINALARPSGDARQRPVYSRAPGPVFAFLRPWMSCERQTRLEGGDRAPVAIDVEQSRPSHCTSGRGAENTIFACGWDGGAKLSPIVVLVETNT